MKVLLIENGPSTIETISLALEIRWPDVRIVTVSDAERATRTVEIESPDVAILDLEFPGGFDILKSIRLFSDVA